MQLPPIGTQPTSKLDERPAPVAAPSATGAVGRQPTASAPAEPSREEVSAAVEKLNGAMHASSQSLRFEIDSESKEIVVKIVDRDTGEMVRQIPTKEALDRAKAIDKMQGLLIDQTA